MMLILRRCMGTAPKNLLRHLASQIRAGGPLTVASYMREVLTNSSMGYYMTRDIFGEKGDFTTSPEISQMFGEMIGVWIVNEWMNLKEPTPFQIVELGPGRGTLASDILRVTKKFPKLNVALSMHMIDISPAMRYLQQEVLRGNPLPKSLPESRDLSARVEASCTSQFGVPVHWHADLGSVPRQASCYLAHEFLDALPIHKFQKVDGKWSEVMIDVDPDTITTVDIANEPRLRFVLSKAPTPGLAVYLPLLPAVSLESRDHAEVCPEAGSLVQELGERLVECGGCALLIDYGHSGEKMDTFRAFKSHHLHDPLLDPGSADLTADVDFSFLAKMLRDKCGDEVAIHGAIMQRSFLSNMGIVLRLEILLRHCRTSKQRQDLVSGLEKLMNSDEMGDRFKVMALLPVSKDNENYVPAGFTSPDTGLS